MSVGMDKQSLLKRLMTTFLEELAEHVVTLNRELLALEKGPADAERAERLQTLFRTAHSLKGAARSVNVALVEAACHHLEEILAAVRDGRLALDTDTLAVLFAAADALEDAERRLRQEQDLGAGPLAALLPRLETAAQSTWTPAGEVVAASEPPRRQSARGVAPPPGDGVSPPSEREPASPPEAPTGTAVVRVPADKLDRLLAQSGELLVARRRVQSRVQDLVALRELVGRWRQEWRLVARALARLGTARPNGTAADERRLPRRAAERLARTPHDLRQLERDLDRLAATLAGDGRLLDETAAAVDHEVRRVRMLPFAEACQGLERMVRDLAQAAGKEIAFAVEGDTVELDRSVLEALKDPLRHLVRNAVDHGIEAPADRRAAGKRLPGRIGVAAHLRGAQVEAVVTDDGRGIDLDAVRRQAQKRGLDPPADDRELARFIFLPGFSTAPLITDVSGRGVGLDVVKSRLEGLHGTVEVSFTPGNGTRFVLTVPLTLTTIRALLVSSRGQTFALVGMNVRKLLRVNGDEFRSVEGRAMLALGGAPLPVASLADTLGLPSAEPGPRKGKLPAVLVSAGERQMVFLVDELLLEQEVVIKGLGARVRRARHVSGATILPSGQIALVLNAAALIQEALDRPPRMRASVPGPEPAARAKKRILLAEDSVTTRTLEKSILEAAGYEVAVAADGQAAWHLLQEGGADLLVSDVEMPRMDGFALTEAVRRSKRFPTLPIVLVTARESERDRARGIEVGADAYLVKSAFDQRNLLQTIAQLL